MAPQFSRSCDHTPMSTLTRPPRSVVTEDVKLRAVKAMRADGMTRDQIADVLGISQATYYRHAAKVDDLGGQLGFAKAVQAR
jgi:transposase